MQNINWNEAPEWAKGHAKSGEDGVWFNDTHYAYSAQFLPGNTGPYEFSREGVFLCTLERKNLSDEVLKPELVDWREAPEWATKRGAAMSAGNYALVWFNDEQYHYVGATGPYLLRTDGCWSYNFSADEFFWVEERPHVVTVQRWSGCGLPLVGDRCEVFMGSEWSEVTVLSYGVSTLRYNEGDSVVTLGHMRDGALTAALTRRCQFRKLRTEEEKEMDQFVMQALEVSVSGEFRRDDAEALYKAGLRFV